VTLGLLLPLLLPEATTASWRYDRAALSAGEYWRWLSAHLVHLDTRHAAINALAAGILVLLFFDAFRGLHWLACVSGAWLAINLGLWWLAPEVDWYVGASGVLHGVIAAGALVWWRARDPRAWILLALLGSKLVYEYLQGTALGFSGDQPVVLAAHRYGSFGGAFGVALYFNSESIRARLRSRPQR
jgi:rhomboid family GlyGly-CTERM serine protease